MALILNASCKKLNVLEFHRPSPTFIHPVLKQRASLLTLLIQHFNTLLNPHPFRLILLEVDVKNQGLSFEAIGCSAVYFIAGVFHLKAKVSLVYRYNFWLSQNYFRLILSFQGITICREMDQIVEAGDIHALPSYIYHF